MSMINIDNTVMQYVLSVPELPGNKGPESDRAGVCLHLAGISTEGQPGKSTLVT